MSTVQQQILCWWGDCTLLILEIINCHGICSIINEYSVGWYVFLHPITKKDTSFSPATCFILSPSWKIWPKDSLRLYQEFVLSGSNGPILLYRATYAALPFLPVSWIHSWPQPLTQTPHFVSSILPGVTPQSLPLRPRSPLLCPRSLSAGCSILPNNHGVHLGLLQLPPKNLWRKHSLDIDRHKYTWMFCFFSYHPLSPLQAHEHACRCIHMQANTQIILLDLHATWPVSSTVPILSCWYFQ